MIKKITYQNKVAIQNDTEVAEINKVTDANMNEIKQVVNNNADEITNQDNLIEKLQQENAKLKSQIPTGKEVGEDITLPDSSNMPFNKFVVRGKSEQETRSGKNKIDLSNINALAYCTATVQDETLNVTPKDDTTNPAVHINCDLIMGEYYLHFERPVDMNIAFFDADGNKVNATNYQSSQVITLTGDAKIMVINTGAGTGAYSLSFKDLYINEGNTDLGYEAYGASPSPEYPSRIRNVGDDINLFDFNMVQDGHETTKAIIKNGFKATGKYYVKIVGISLKKNTDYYLQYITENIIGTYKLVRIYNSENNELIKEFFSGNGGIFNSGEATSVYMYFYASIGTTSGEVNFINIKLQEGSTATAYSPYGYGSVEIEKLNKNLLNITDEEETTIGNVVTMKKENQAITLNGTIPATYTIPIEGAKTSGDYPVLFKMKKGKSYFFKLHEISGSISAYTTSFSIRSKTGIPFQGTTFQSIKNGYKFTPTQDEEIVGIFSYTTETTFTNYKFAIQVEESDVATDYTPHQSETFIFPVAEPLHEGDYLAEDGIHSKRTTLIFDGTEGIVNNVTVLGNTTRFVSALTVSTGNTANALCSHFEYNYNYTLDEEHIYIGSSGNIYFFVDSNKVTNMEEAQAWLAEQYANGIPVTLEYELVEEVTKPYTEEQQEVYNNILNSNTYKNITHISAGGDVKPELEVGYYKDLQSLLKQLTDRIIALEGVS